MKPRLAYRVDNKLANDDSKLGVELRFNSMDDFHPENVVNQVEPLRKLADARKKLSDLLSKMDGNDRLVELMDEVIKSTDALQKLNKEAGSETSEKTGKEEKNG
jgi:type VI secretion system protein ImpB